MKRIALLIALAALVLANIYWGAVHIPATDVTQILLGHGGSQDAWSFIIWENRVPQAITAALCGAGLAVAGLLLQTLFRNPLAGPGLLGIDSGANLGVAIAMLMLGGSFAAGAFTMSGFFLVLFSAFVGALAVMMVLIAFSTTLRSDVMLLIVGVMIGYLASSAISLLNYGATEEGVRSFMMWGLGSFANVTSDRLPAFALTMSTGLVAALLFTKPLNALLLGNNYAANLGIHVRRTRTFLLLITGLLTATSVAFCGPVSFIGLAVPHLARLFLGTSNHRALLPATLLTGACLALFCNLVSTLPEHGLIPINVITPVLGAPVVIWIIMKKD
ncbi:MAG: iron ABC transporter permease [Bacteroidales bacterium]|nr:iron ABC transporter permease [Bacteroidales bacterium]